MIFYWFVQNFIVWPLAGVVLRILFKIEIRGRENLAGVRPPLIIASNHKTLIDGFLLMIALPWLSPVLPGRYMTEEFEFRARALRILARLRILRFFYILTGGFPSKRGQGIENAIKIPAAILKNGGTVLMFPEGKLVRENSLGQFYHGTSALVLAATVSILPVYIKVSRGKFTITFGKVFSLETASKEEGTEILKKKIEELQ